MSTVTQRLKTEIFSLDRSHYEYFNRTLKKYIAMKKYKNAPPAIMRAMVFTNVILGHKIHIYKNDRIVGSARNFYLKNTDPKYTEERKADTLAYVKSVGERGFGTNADHSSPNYARMVEIGVPGYLKEVGVSLNALDREAPDYAEKATFLKSVGIVLRAFEKYFLKYARKAKQMAKTETSKTYKKYLLDIALTCENLATGAPSTFREGLQLIWFTHIAYGFEGRYAMALGRIDQALIKLYKKDVSEGRLDYARALGLIENTFIKMAENPAFWGGDNVANISVGGYARDGSDGTNEVSFLVLDAVKNCHIVGPNLSARFHHGTPLKFYLKCLEVIKSGIGYPALFNDDVNVPALHRLGYTIEDSRDHCYVGCIENFIQGRQVAWTDGRFNTPKYIELALNRGRSMETGVLQGIETGDPAGFDTFDKFMDAFKAQIEYAAKNYAEGFIRMNTSVDPKVFISPFLSAFYNDCIARAKDINDGGAIYPMNHGVATMGIGTVSDSLAALEQTVYVQKRMTLGEMIAALKADFKGYESVQEMLKNSMPKYGNDDDTADKFAVWYVEYHQKLFEQYRTPGNGHFVIGIAANTSNIGAGQETYATPDGRNAHQPLSDAGSPTYGVDRKGITSVINSVTKPDYTLVGCGSVINQKLSPTLLKDEFSMRKVASLLKTYFEKGGQEMQLNVVDNKTLLEAIKNPEKYRDLIVRVSGFSARFVELHPKVREDILSRTQHKF